MTAVLLVGCGNMGHAMLRGWHEADAGFDIYVVEPAEPLRQRAAAFCTAAVARADALPDGLRPAIVVLAVKPQAIRDVLPDYAAFVAGGAAVLSVAAGTAIATIAEKLPAGAAVVRCMPNTPAAIGEGMMVCVGNERATEAVRGLVTRLLSSSGRVRFLEDEEQMDAVTAVSGSGPAYVFHFIECLAGAGEKAGLAPDLARELAVQVVAGAGLLARQSPDDPETLRRQVTSPNGTTAAALSVLMDENRLAVLLTEAVEAARHRSIELR